MKRVLLTRILVSLLVVCSFCIENQKMAVGSTPQVSLTKREYSILPEEEYLKLQDNEIDIAVGSLIIAKRIYPDLNIQKYLNQIDAMAKELEPKLKVCNSPSEIVKTISRYLFVEKKLKYNEDKKFINNVLDEKYGQCSAFSSLYLSITERLQLPFYGVAAPDHMFVRYDDGTVKINIETTAGGDIWTKEEILKSLGVLFLLETAQDGIYLKNLTKRQILSICLNIRGKNYADKEDFDKAIGDFTKAIDMDPKYVYAYYNRGLAFYDKGDFDKAIVNYTKAIDLDPKEAKAYNNRGLAFYDKGDIDKAIVDYNKVIDLNPKDADTYVNRGNAYKNKGDIDRAIVDYNKAMDLNPKDAAAYYNRGTAYQKKGDIDKAIVDYNKAIDLNPKKADTYCRRGEAYQEKGDIDKAIVDYNKAIDLNPKDAVAYFNRGTVLILLKGDVDRALSDLSSAIAINSEDADFYFLRAIVYFSKGDKKNVLQDSKKAIELDSGYKSKIKDIFGKYKVYAEDEEFKKIIQ